MLHIWIFINQLLKSATCVCTVLNGLRHPVGNLQEYFMLHGIKVLFFYCKWSKKAQVFTQSSRWEGSERPREKSPPTCLSSSVQWKRKTVHTHTQSWRPHSCVVTALTLTHINDILPSCMWGLLSVQFIICYWSLQCVTRTNCCTFIILGELIGHYQYIQCHRWAGTRPVLSMCIQRCMYSSSYPLCWCSFPCPRRY